MVRWKDDQLIWSVGAGLLTAVLMIGWINIELRPLILLKAETELTNRVTAVSADVMELGLSSGPPLLTVQTTENGLISGVSADLNRLNQLRGDIAEALHQQHWGNGQRLSVSLGTVLGLHLFPIERLSIPVELYGFETVECSTESSLINAGINQTLYQIDLVIRAELILYLPGGRSCYPVICRVPAAQILIVGEIPENYGYFNSSSTASRMPVFPDS